MLKKAELPSEATALASSVLPVPGGPNSSTPFQLSTQKGSNVHRVSSHAARLAGHMGVWVRAAAWVTSRGTLRPQSNPG